MATAPERIGGSRGTSSPAAPAWAASGSQPPPMSPMSIRLARRLGPMSPRSLLPLLPLAGLLLERDDRRAAHRALRQARVAADRIFAVEHCRLPLHQLADVARRELHSAGHQLPRQAAAFLDSLALAAIAAQRVLGLRPHLAQLAAAVSVLQGRAAELGCGEGKSLALAMAAAVRALSGTPVHLVLRDDRDVEAQAALLRPFFVALDLQVGVVTAVSSAVARRAAYAADVCLATARELACDHRPDHWPDHPAARTGDPRSEPASGRRRPEQTCALIDDVDALLVDEALEPFDLPGEPRQLPPITPQAFFSRYAALGGASATLAEARRELACIYGMGVTTIASIYPSFRQELGASVSPGVEQWLRQVVQRVRMLVELRRAVLLTARDETACRQLAAALQAVGVDAMRLRAADAVDGRMAMGQPSRPGQVAICTRAEALRGCRRIEVDAYARAAGGLAVVATDFAATRREERRLAALAGHRGQPGSIETIAMLPLPSLLAHLPAPAMRSFMLVRRQLAEWRAERQRSLRARLPSRQQGSEPPAAQPHATHLQHEGS